MSDDKDRNRAFLTGLWLEAAASVVVAVVSVMVSMVVLANAPVENRMAAAVLPPLFFAFVIVFIRRDRGKFERNLRRQLRESPSAHPIIATYEEVLLNPRARMPHRDAVFAQGSASILAFYGEPYQATAAADSVDWRDRPPIIGALRLMAEAHIQLLGHRDFEAALSAARRSRAMADPGGDFPGNEVAANASDSLVEACRLLADRSDADECLASLEARLAAKPLLLLELLILWVLATAYSQRGDAARAAEMTARYREIAPHCVPPG